MLPAVEKGGMESDMRRGSWTAEKTTTGHLRAMLMAHDMPLLRWQGTKSIFKRLLTLVLGVALFVLLVTSYNTLVPSYMDLMDDIIAEQLDTDITAIPSTTPISTLDTACRDGSGWVEEWISSGVMPKCSLAHQSTIDILYTLHFVYYGELTVRWVNGSEAQYQHEKNFWQDRSPVFGGSGKAHDRKVMSTERRHREHDELRYSVRSIFKYFAHGFHRIHILASDFYNGTAWQGQVPGWLDTEKAAQHGVSLLYTSELYGADRAALPVFNSLALESKLSGVDATSDVILYLNDDMFLASEHTVSDFWNPLTGLEIQVQPRLVVQAQDASVTDFQNDWNSEWTPLRYTNHVLNQRFGFRRRTYVAHHGKVLSRTILRELAQTFPSQLNETSSHRFRAEGRDVNTIFLHTHYVMERHRETLLESLLLHRCDANGDGKLDMEERQVLVTQIQTALEQRSQRKSLQEQLLGMGTADLPLPKVSTPVWAATDGYPFALKDPSNPITIDNPKAPDPDCYTWHDAPHARTPSFDFIEMCLTNDFVKENLSKVDVDAQLLFQLLSKEYPYCGDTLLSILIPSTTTGLAHILPPPSHPQYSRLTHQLHKYAYTLSTTSSEFIMAKNAALLVRGFNRALTTLGRLGLAQICVNDDLEIADGVAVRKWDNTLRGILQGYFGGFTEGGGQSPVEKAETVGEGVNEEGNSFWNSAGFKGGPGY